MEQSGAETEGRRRVVVERVRPEIDGGRFPIKRVVGEEVVVEADVIVDGHDILAVRLLHAPLSGDTTFREEVMEPRGNDLYRARFHVGQCGFHRYTVEAWVDGFATAVRGLSRKVEAGQDVRVELLDIGKLVAAAAGRASGVEHHVLGKLARDLEDELGSIDERIARVLDPELAQHMAKHPDRSTASRYEKTLQISVDPPYARFSSWYELFPRSCGEGGRHGTFADVERMLPYVQQLGFDVLYLPPIHPIGRTHRKGPNNTLVAGPNDPGSPWAIGGAEGGHTAVHPELGTLAEFEHLVQAARAMGIEIAMDIAFQASPDHPWVREHPDWFHRRADGSIQYAENPPKKYQDVLPFAFDAPSWPQLWAALRDVFLFWVARGVRVFRVDNPHTKPLPFWDWCLAEVKRVEPSAIFLAEAFTRPKLMLGLAKRGFSQSYTYFTWRTSKPELEKYLLEISSGELGEVMRPNFWPNTPDILPEELQHGGRAAFMRRAVLAATMSSNWGVYGPAFELMEHVARPGSEEYVDNEKYELKKWDLGRADSLSPLLTTLNRVRRENRAFQGNNVRVHGTDDPTVVAFSKRAPGSVVLVVVLLDGHHPHGCWLDLDLAALGVEEDETFQVHDLLSDGRWDWHGRRAYIHLDPREMPAHVFRIRRSPKNETSFEYYDG